MSEWTSVPRETGASISLLSIDAVEGASMGMTLCIERAAPADPRPPTIALWMPETGELVYKAELDASWFTNAECAAVGRGELEHTGRYEVTLVRESVSDTDATKTVSDTAWPRLRAGVFVSKPVTNVETWLIRGLFVALFAWLVSRRERTSEPPTKGYTPMPLLAAGLVTYALAFYATRFLPGGVLGIVLRGGLLIGVSLAFGIGAASRERSEPVRLLPWRIALAVALPFVVGFLVTTLTPPTVDAPVTAVFDVPSTRLAAVVVASFAPFAEELFFRAFVQGALEARIGKLASALLSAGIFVLFHLPQTGLEPAAWAPIATLGLGASWLRATTGTSRASILAHAVHNAWRTLG